MSASELYAAPEDPSASEAGTRPFCRRCGLIFSKLGQCDACGCCSECQAERAGRCHCIAEEPRS